MIWDQWIAQLNTLSHEADDWDTFDTFLSTAQEIKNQKIALRDDSRRLDLNRAIAALYEQYSSLIDYLRYGSLRTWAVREGAAADLFELEDQVEALRLKLSQYMPLFANPLGSSIIETRQILSEMDALENEIADLFRQMDPVLAGGRIEEPAAGVPAVEEPAEAPAASTATHPVEETPKDTPPAAEPEPTSPEAGDSETDGRGPEPAVATTPKVGGEVPDGVEDGGITPEVLVLDLVQGLQKRLEKEPNEAPEPPAEPGAESEFLPQGKETEEGHPSEVEDAESSLPFDIFGQKGQPGPASAPDDVYRIFAPNVNHKTGSGAHAQAEENRQPVLPPEIERILRFQTEDLSPLDGSRAVDQLAQWIESGKLVEAYWMAEALEYQEQPCLFPAWLVQALLCAQWTAAEWPAHPEGLPDRLKQILLRHSLPERTEEQGWLVLASVLFPALIHPEPAWQPLLTVPSDLFPEFTDIANGIVDFYNQPSLLEYGLFLQLSRYIQYERRAQDAVKEAKSWLETGPSRNIKHAPAYSVWINLSSPSGELYSWMDRIAANNYKELDHEGKPVKDRAKLLDQLQVFIDHWSDEGTANEEVQGINAKISRERGFSPDVIKYDAIDKLMGLIGEVCQIAAAWLDAIRQIEQIKQHVWQLEEGLAWMHTVQPRIQAALPVIESAWNTAGQPAERAVLACLRRTLAQLGVHFGVFSDLNGRTNLFLPDMSFRDNSPSPDLLNDLLSTVPARYPELRLDDTGQPELNELEKLAVLLLNEPERDPALSIKGWVALHDYRFTNRLLAAPTLEEDERQSLADEVRQQAVEDLRRLKRRLDQAVQVIEQAVLDELINEADRTTYISHREAVLSRVRPVELNLVQRQFSENIASYSGQLDETIFRPLEELRQAQLADQRGRWPGMMERLKDEMLLGRLAGSDYQVICEAVENSLQQAMLRATQEQLSNLASYLNEQGILSHSLFRGSEKPDVLAEFQRFRPAIAREGGSKVLLNLGPNRPVQLGDRDLANPKELKRVLEDWMAIAQNAEEATASALDRVRGILAFLGFEFHSPSPVVARSTDLARVNQMEMKSWRVTVRPHHVVPIPEFGSSAPSAWTYDIIGVWPGSGVDIANVLRNLTHKTPYIIFYFGRLTDNQQAMLGSIARSKNLYTLVLDESLLIYLAWEKGSRLEAFFECTVPYTAVNPYPNSLGEIPEEIFFGRKKELNSLSELNGTAIMYGGRGMGKTSLLAEVVHRQNSPANQWYAFVISLKGIKNHAPYHQVFWNLFAQALENNKVVSWQKARAKSYERMQELLIKEIKDRSINVLALFDEADEFLEMDAAQSFRVILDLQKIRKEAQQRFKAVFMGVHNVQRFNRIPNHPLTQFGLPQEVGPLDPESSLQLIRDPLHVLGYRFEGTGTDSTSPLLLYALSFTNYHPAILQSFSHHLVEHMRQNMRSEPFPVYISRQDIEAVARKTEVQENIRERFTLTLRLDEKYEIITLHMVLDQWNKNNGFQQLYSPREIYDGVSRDLPRWFADTSIPEVQILLQEMRGLGVLSYDKGHDRYHLRSPNIISLLGTYESLKARLEELANSEPPAPYQMTSCHPAFLPDMQEFSPLSYQQSTELYQQRSGVSLVFGSDALGMDLLDKAIEEMVNPSITSVDGVAWNVMNLVARTGQAVKDWLEDFHDHHSAANQLFVFRRLEGTPDEMCEQVEAAYLFCRRFSASLFRVVFALDPIATLDWFCLPPDTRRKFEQEIATPAIWLRPWDMVGIQQRMERAHSDLQAKEANCAKVLKATGGWQLLVDAFFETNRGTPAAFAGNLPALVDTFNAGMEMQNSPLRSRFFNALGLVDRNVSYILERFLREADGVPKDLIFMLFEEEADRTVLSEPVIETAERYVEYLERMSILVPRVDLDKSQVTLIVDPLVARLWRYGR